MPWLLSAILALVAIAIATISALSPPGSAPRSVADAGGVSINGSPIDRSVPTAVDFAKSFDVAGLGSGSSAKFSASILGVPLGSVEAPLTAGRATVEPGYLQWTTAGAVNLAVTIDGASEPWTTVVVAPSQPWYLTAPALALVLIGLFGLANLQSNVQGLRGGRIRVGSILGLVIAGLVVGISGAVLITMWTATVPRGQGVALTALAAGGWAVAHGEGYRRWRRRRRSQLIFRR